MHSNFSRLLIYMFCLALCACSKEKTTGCYKAKLVIKGPCLNYTIQVTDPAFDKSLVESSWTDPQTGTIYNNVFKLGSICNFPTEINESDTFYFKIDTDPSPLRCMVCLAYYPTPSKALSISASKSGCE